MIDNINKLSTHLDTNKSQQTAASIVNLTDDGEILVTNLSFISNLDKNE
jgi:hypothetical protein